MRWEQGRTTIDQMIGAGELQRALLHSAPEGKPEFVETQPSVRWNAAVSSLERRLRSCLQWPPAGEYEIALLTQLLSRVSKALAGETGPTAHIPEVTTTRA